MGNQESNRAEVSCLNSPMVARVSSTFQNAYAQTRDDHGHYNDDSDNNSYNTNTSDDDSGNDGYYASEPTVWQKYSHSMLRYLNPYEDCIEFDRGTYSHFALYIGHGKCVHFNPANSDEKVGPHNMAKWFPGAITCTNLRQIAGDDEMHVAEYDLGPKRPERDIKYICKYLLEHNKLFKYCLGRFNCEHVVNFIKFGKVKSKQADKLHLMESTIEDLLDKVSIHKFKTLPTSTDWKDRKHELGQICHNLADCLKIPTNSGLLDNIYL